MMEQTNYEAARKNHGSAFAAGMENVAELWYGPLSAI
jgi:hypothetical protein